MRDCSTFLGHAYAHNSVCVTQYTNLRSIACTYCTHTADLLLCNHARERERERERESKREDRHPSLIRRQQTHTHTHTHTHTLLTAVCQTLTAAMLLFPSCSLQMACFGLVLTSHRRDKYFDSKQKVFLIRA